MALTRGKLLRSHRLANHRKHRCAAWTEIQYDTGAFNGSVAGLRIILHYGFNSNNTSSQQAESIEEYHPTQSISDNLSASVVDTECTRDFL